MSLKKQKDGTRIHHSLEEHLHNVACLTSEKELIAAAGRGHDLGKYHSSFQNYINSCKASGDDKNE